MKDMNRIAEAMNALCAFLGVRDIPALTRDALRAHCGIAQVDVCVLFGGSILAGGDLLAEAMRNGIAKRYVIVGGAGHTTDALRGRIRAECPETDTARLSEAECFDMYLSARYGLHADALETKSTNCGNNVTNLLGLLREKGYPFGSILFMQDASMQRRMDAGFRKHFPADTLLINYAVYRAEVIPGNGELCFDGEIRGMWDLDRYLELLMGEIPRLRDDENGYGPNGKDFIAHTDVPEEVLTAYELLRERFGLSTRQADTRFATVPRPE